MGSTLYCDLPGSGSGVPLPILFSFLGTYLLRHDAWSQGFLCSGDLPSQLIYTVDGISDLLWSYRFWCPSTYPITPPSHIFPSPRRGEPRFLWSRDLLSRLRTTVYASTIYYYIISIIEQSSLSWFPPSSAQ